MMRTILRNVAGLRGRYVGFSIVVAVLVATGSAGLVISSNAPTVFEQQLNRSVASRTIIVQAPVGSNLVLDDAAIGTLRALPGVEAVEETYALGGDITFGDAANTLTISVLPLRSTFVPPLAAGTTQLGPRDALIPEIIDSRSMTATLGTEITVLRNITLRPGETVSRPERLRVVGLVEPYWQLDARNPVYIPPALAREWLAEATSRLGPGSIPLEGFSSVNVLTSPASPPGGVLGAIQDLGFQATTAAQIGGEIPESLQAFVSLSNAIRYAGIALGLIMAFVFVRTMLLSRLPEVGLLKSFGYTTPRIVASLGGEILLVTVVGAALGLLGGATAAYAVAVGVAEGALPPGSAMAVAMPSPTLAIAVLAVALVAVTVAAAVPLLGAARKPAIVAMRTRK